MKTLLFLLLLVPIIGFGQSKKKQIEALNFSLDSLNTLLSNTRTNSAKESKELNNSINNLNKEKEKLNISIEQLNSKIEALKRDNNISSSSIKTLIKENDKLKIDLAELSKQNLAFEAKLKILEDKENSTLNHLPSYNSERLKDWLEIYDAYLFYGPSGYKYIQASLIGASAPATTGEAISDILEFESSSGDIIEFGFDFIQDEFDYIGNWDGAKKLLEETEEEWIDGRCVNCGDWGVDDLTPLIKPIYKGRKFHIFFRKEHRFVYSEGSVWEEEVEVVYALIPD